MITNLPWFQQQQFYIPKEGEKMPVKEDEATPPAAAPPPEGAPPPPRL